MLMYGKKKSDEVISQRKKNKIFVENVIGTFGIDLSKN